VADLSKTPRGIRQLVEQYDKLLMFLSLVLLLASLLYLAVRVGSIRQLQEQFDQVLQSYRPSHPEAAVVSPDLYEQAAALLEQPPVIAVSGWTNVMLSVPPRRVVCTDANCLRPVPYDADVCPHCLSEQLKPKVEEADPDLSTAGDDIPDVWKLSFGLDIYEPIAHLDLDGDGFTVREEFQADTDPTDPRSHPPLTDKLYVREVTSTAFGMLYRTRLTGADGQPIFGLNYLEDGETRTARVRIGDVIDGYTVTAHEEKRVRNASTGGWDDVSELTLVRNDHVIILVRHRPFREVELTAHLVFELDDSTHTVKRGELLELRDHRFEVIEIDRQARRVVLNPDHEDSEPVTVGPLPRE